MHVHFTYAGGTIGMVDSPRGLRPGAGLEAWLSDLLIVFPTASRPRTTVTTLQPLLDSAQAAPRTWQAIVNDINAHACADAFVVLHGTDTLAYTASALSYALTALTQPVVATGSQLPFGAPGSDAAANVTGALGAITQGAPPGVHLFFGGRLLAGNRATKTSTWSFQGFDSPNTAPTARAGAPWQWSGRPETADSAGNSWSTPRPFGQHDVVVLDVVPGLAATRLAELLTPPPLGVVLRAFGVGNLPAELTAVIAEAVAAGVTVVITSQCLQGAVELDRYAVGSAVAATGAVSGGDMTVEAAYTKLQFLASQGLRGAELGAWMRRNLAGELTVPAVRK